MENVWLLRRDVEIAHRPAKCGDYAKRKMAIVSPLRRGVEVAGTVDGMDKIAKSKMAIVGMLERRCRERMGSVGENFRA